jgi:hypothetical protein
MWGYARTAEAGTGVEDGCPEQVAAGGPDLDQAASLWRSIP